jgi:hypothetical protein
VVEKTALCLDVMKAEMLVELRAEQRVVMKVDK